jgi:cell pole-organizing protein PopZ
MEEILASIRKIISEDSTEAPAAPVAAASAPAAAAPAAEADVLELTQELPEEPAPPPLAPVRAASAPSKPESDVVFQTIEEPTVAAQAPAVHDDIFSDKTRKALDDTFANIPDEKPVRPAARGASPGLAGLDGSSVEAVFERAVTNAFDPVLDRWMDKNKQDLLTAVKPLIREWMDEHFPALLEGAVRNEVERVVKARGNKR